MTLGENKLNSSLTGDDIQIFGSVGRNNYNNNPRIEKNILNLQRIFICRYIDIDIDI